MRHIFGVLTLALVWLSPLGAQAPAEVQLKAAMNREVVDGDLAGAIEQYKGIIAKYPKNREVVAKALLQLAGCHEKLGNREARQSYERIIRDYGDISAVATIAKARLGTIRTEGAAPFVRRTLDPDLESGSPDGRVAIYHKGEGFGRVFARDLASGAERLLIDLEGSVSNFAWSPDSRSLAFDFQNVSKKTRETRIVAVATGVMRTLPVRHGYPLGWTAGGDLLFYRPNYAGNKVDFTLARSDDGSVRRELAQPVAEGCCPIITPDGARLLVPKGKRLMVVDVETGTERALTEGSAEEIRPVLSADGRLAAFASNRDGKWAIYVAPLDRAPVRDPLLLGFVDENAITGRRGQRYDWWTSSGTLTIPLSHTENNIYRLPVDPTTGRATGAAQRLTQDAPRNFGPAVSPDGSQIAYQYRNGSKAGIALMDAAGVSERPVIELQGNLPIHWRSTDEILYYNFAAPSGERPAITTYNVKSGLKTPVARVEGLYWQYIPSRNAIVHSHPGGGGPRAGNRLKIWSIADGTDRDVASIDFLVPWWSVSPDGRRIAFSVARNADTSGVQCELALMSIDGVHEKTLMGNDGRATQFGSDPSICGVPTSWSPDGRFLLVNTTTKGARVVNVETGEAWPLHPSIDTQNWDARSWSPDGKFIAITFSSSRVERLAWEGVTYEAVTRLLARTARR